MKDNNWNGEGLPSVGQMVCTETPSQHIYQVMLPFNDHNETCLKTTSSELFVILRLSQLKPIPSPEETAKQKAIQEIQQSINACLQKGLSTGESVYMDGYRKVKPLSFKNYKEIAHESKGTRYEYNTLISEGYCIGSTD
jgi:hypothetical protein